jgi:copper oxidase (laccase) domain-containing protein
VLVVGKRPPPGAGAWAPSADGAAPEADAVVAVGTGSCAVVLTADCAPVALGSPGGIHGAVHVGWRGLVAGVIDGAVATMRALGAGDVVAGLGPTIHPCCYEFGAADLDTVAAAVGGGVRGVTAAGSPALDLPAAVRARLADIGVEVVVDVDRCTGCGGGAFSHRVGGDRSRQALFVWSENDGTDATQGTDGTHGTGRTDGTGWRR